MERVVVKPASDVIVGDGPIPVALDVDAVVPVDVHDVLLAVAECTSDKVNSLVCADVLKEVFELVLDETVFESGVTESDALELSVLIELAECDFDVVDTLVRTDVREAVMEFGIDEAIV